MLENLCLISSVLGSLLCNLQETSMWECTPFAGSLPCQMEFSKLIWCRAIIALYETYELR